MADTTLLPSPAELAPLTNSAKKPTPDTELSSGLPPTLAPIKSISVEHEDGSKTLHIPAPIAKATSEASAPPDDGSVAPNPAIAKSPALLPSPGYAKMVDSPESIPSVPTSGKSLAPVGPKPSGASADSSSNGVSNTSSGSEQSLGAPEDAANLATQLKPLPQFSAPPNTTPSLEPQGGKHALTRFLSRLTGLSAETPKPGQPYTGPIGSSEKMKAGAKFAQAIGFGLTAAAGRPQESELAMQMPMKQRQMELETAALKNEAAYRSGMLSNNANKNVIAEQKNVGNMRAKGYVPNEAAPGEYRSMTPEEIAADPSLSLSFDTKKAAQDASNAKAEYQRTLSYYQAHPNAQVKAQLEIADKRLKATMMMFHARFGLEQDRLRMQSNMGEMQTGVNPLTNSIWGQDDLNVSPEALSDKGNPVPLRMQAMFSPTQQQKNAGGQAAQTVQQTPQLLSEINALREKLGPVSGRWNKFMTGELGVQDEDLSGLRADLTMWSTAVALSHAFGRMPENLRQEFASLINAPQQDPDNLISIVSHVNSWMTSRATVSTPNTMSRSSISPIHRAASSGGGEVEYVRNAQGKLVKKGQ